MRLSILLATAMLLSAGAPTRAQLFQPGSRQTPHPAVVRVIAAEPGGASLGSGTLVDVNDDHGLVITNWHVVREAPGSVIVVFPDGFQSMGRVLRMDSNWDLAAILINRPQASPVRVARDAPRLGEPLTIAGYGSGSYRAAVGACTQYLAPSMQHPYELVELAASARQGDSGGPILNGRGELAGVLFGEGDGRTTGAYCGRVHSFLTLAVEQLHNQTARALAGGSGGTAIGSASSESWRASAKASRHDFVNEQLFADNSSGANLTKHATESALPASFHLGSHAQPDGNRSAPATSLAPVAAITPSDHRDSLDSSAVNAPRQGVNGGLDVPQPDTRPIPGESSPSAGGWTPASETNSLVGQFFAGETLVAQLKTVLACVAVAAFLYHGGKILIRTSAASSRPAKRQVKR